MREIIFILSLSLIVCCASKSKTFSIVNVVLIEDRDGRDHIYDREVVEGKAIWCIAHKQYEKIEVKRLHNQSSLIKEHAND
tara:strand:+ start:239 stop:481 length:243 start_codon:yes stop_codon:yes gene_type:complete